MKVEERRHAIAMLLGSTDKAISGSDLAERFGVSRQIIVQDMAALKACGYDIISTRNGYLLQKSPFVSKIFKVKHTSEQSEDELLSIVDLGGCVVDVFVWHKVYGKISAPLDISSRWDVQKFIEGVRSGKSTELMHITGGYHYHTVRAPSGEVLNLIERVLSQKHYIVPELDYSSPSRS